MSAALERPWWQDLLSGRITSFVPVTGTWAVHQHGEKYLRTRVVGMALVTRCEDDGPAVVPMVEGDGPLEFVNPSTFRWLFRDDDAASCHCGRRRGEDEHDPTWCTSCGSTIPETW